MKAIAHQRYGPAGVLALTDLPIPAPGEGEVLVRVRAAGVDTGVIHLMTGRPYLMRPATGLRAPRKQVRGTDVAGTVEAVGAGVTRFRPGEAVFGSCDAAFAEYAVAQAGKLAPMPGGIGFEAAAAVPTSGATALMAVRGRVAAGQKALIIGAGGGVGGFAVQLARARGAHVTGVCGPGKADHVRELGADHVVDYTREEVTGRYDLVVDTAGGRPLRRLRRLLTPGGALVIVGSERGGPWLGGMHRQLRAALLNPFTRQSLHALFVFTTAAHLDELAGYLASGQVRPLVSATYPLEEAAAAVAHVARGHTLGKVVVTLGSA
ncbi:NAD(P)-dependent alcohol dehydrogenase [Nonomuraea typhae]|uniref:NAD(P)-dependent alcohol dehydrogenase n=1 Tax=Nonomuraea typhae TaxID=2603600 RepID=UPI0012FB85BF|nr:NAD(P)-dependent alcohol dehydrogenase [Nonomuraea typhae]